MHYDEQREKERDKELSINMKNKSKDELIKVIEGLVPILDLLQHHIDDSASLVKSDSEYQLKLKDGSIYCSGASIRKLMINLIFTDC